MSWDAGRQEPWPALPFRITEGEMLLVSSGDRDFALLRLEADRIYPGLPEPIANAITLKLQAIQTSRVELLADGDDSEGRQWLGQRLSEELDEELVDGISLPPARKS